MNDLDALGKALRDELGAPPANWQERQLRRLKSERQGSPEPPRFRWPMAIALGFAVLSGVYLGFNASDDEHAVASHWLDAKTTSLPYEAFDGSNIRLEAGGQGRFFGGKRGSRFELHTGQATFDVNKRPGQDWVVVAGRYTLRVVGTRFSVNYQAGKLDVSVAEGRVAVSVPERSDPILIEAGQRLTAEGERVVLDGSAAALALDAAQVSNEPVNEGNTDAPMAVDPVSVVDETDGSSDVSDGPAAPAAAPQYAGSDWHALYK
jgi:ferric-dicitrate binding protein FerR (iron transport regulator)